MIFVVRISILLLTVQWIHTEQQQEQRIVAAHHVFREYGSVNVSVGQWQHKHQLTDSRHSYLLTKKDSECH